MSTNDDTTGRVTDETVEADERDARATHGADRAPTPEEEAAAERNPEVSPESAEAYEEAIERGADVAGEGQIDL
jgi:ribosomal protein S10